MPERSDRAAAAGAAGDRPPPAKAEGVSYPGLDLVRFWAAATVALFHLAYYWWSRKQDLVAVSFREDLDFLAPFASQGASGVQTFFTLSGLVIAVSASGRSWDDFLRRRILRLYPAAWACSTLTLLACLAIGEQVLLLRYAKSLALSPTGPWIDGVMWSLGLEIVFYLYVCGVLRMAGSARLERAGLALGAVSTLYWLLRVADSAAGGPFGEILAVPATAMGKLLLLRDGCFFALGMLIWAIAEKGASRLRLTAAALFSAACLASLGKPGAIALWAIGVAAICASIGWNRAISAALRPWARAIRVIGLSTYPLYLLHNEIGIAAMRALHPMGAVPALAAALALVLALTLLVTLVLEPAIRTRLRAALEGGRRASAAGARRGRLLVVAIAATVCLASTAIAWAMPGPQVPVAQLAGATALVTIALSLLEAFRRSRSRAPLAAAGRIA